MQKLRPTLWRTCRVISNKSRLALLWRLFQMGTMSMGELAKANGLRNSQASEQLRALNARGLIKAERRMCYVYYSAEPNLEVEFSVGLLAVLRECHDRGDSFSLIGHQATAYTHPRRIEIVRFLSRMEGGATTGQIGRATSISAQALGRHLAKLQARGIVGKEKDRYRLTPPEHPLGAFLLTVATDRSV